VCHQGGEQETAHDSGKQECHQRHAFLLLKVCACSGRNGTA